MREEGSPVLIGSEWDSCADFLCDSIDDQVEIRAAIALAQSLGVMVEFLPATYNITKPTRIYVGTKFAQVKV